MISKKCPYCTKKIEAYTDKQADHLLKQHILSSHPEMITFKPLPISKKLKEDIKRGVE